MLGSACRMQSQGAELVLERRKCSNWSSGTEPDFLEYAKIALRAVVIQENYDLSRLLRRRLDRQNNYGCLAMQSWNIVLRQTHLTQQNKSNEPNEKAIENCRSAATNSSNLASQDTIGFWLTRSKNKKSFCSVKYDYLSLICRRCRACRVIFQYAGVIWSSDRSSHPS